MHELVGRAMIVTPLAPNRPFISHSYAAGLLLPSSAEVSTASNGCIGLLPVELVNDGGHGSNHDASLRKGSVRQQHAPCTDTHTHT